MVQLGAFFRRSLRVVALALCAAAIVASATPASARSHHGASRHEAHHAGRHHVSHHRGYLHRRHIVRPSRWDAGMAQMRQRGLADTQASMPSGTASAATASAGGFGSSDVVAEARRYVGGNPTGRANLWLRGS
jgi:hypothetical protein